MTTTQTTRIHPLMAVAAVSLTLVSLVGAASIAGLLPSSHATPDTAPVAANVAPAQPQANQPMQEARPALVEHRTVVHHRESPARNVSHADDTAQTAPPAPVAQNSPLGMGIGAVVGGLIGNQVGGGKGKTAATIAGVVGGAYVGNEIAKKN